ncbi:MAG: homocysteine S-methyltransferase family protein [Solirubrobacteraceae bacterium]
MMCNQRLRNASTSHFRRASSCPWGRFRVCPRTSSLLTDGTSVAQAIEQVDRATSGAAEFFMINCAHPTHIAAGLDEVPALDRIGGLRVNASALSHAELDEAEQLDEGDPVVLGRDNAALHEILPSVRLLGGCCGTDNRHVAEMIAAWRDSV